MVLGVLGDDGVGCHVSRSHHRRPAGRRVVALVKYQMLNGSASFRYDLSLGWLLCCGQGYMCHMFSFIFARSLNFGLPFRLGRVHMGMIVDLYVNDN
jgi:hypothetical protein